MVQIFVQRDALLHFEELLLGDIMTRFLFFQVIRRGFVSHFWTTNAPLTVHFKSRNYVSVFQYSSSKLGLFVQPLILTFRNLFLVYFFLACQYFLQKSDIGQGKKSQQQQNPELNIPVIFHPPHALHKFFQRNFAFWKKEFLYSWGQRETYQGSR